MTAKLQYEERINFIGLLAAIGEGEGAEAADFVLQFMPSADYDEEVKTAFRADMKELFEEKC